MIKRADSLRSQGLTTLSIDTPTKIKLRTQAAAAGMAMSEYIRVLTDNAGGGQQGKMVNLPPTIDVLDRKLVQVDAKLLTLSQAMAYILTHILDPKGFDGRLPVDVLGDIKAIREKLSQLGFKEATTL